MQMGQIDIVDIQIEFNAQDEIPQLLRGLQHLYTNKKTRHRIFTLLDEKMCLRRLPYPVRASLPQKVLEVDVYAPVRTRLTCLFSMPKLSICDARDFIVYRLETAQENPGLFDDDAISALATDAKGNRKTLMNRKKKLSVELNRAVHHFVYQCII